MRLGLVLPEGREAKLARLAEDHGLFGVLAGSGNPMTAIIAAVYASTATDFVRVVTRVQLGVEHPVTIAEVLVLRTGLAQSSAQLVPWSSLCWSGRPRVPFPPMPKALNTRWASVGCGVSR